MENGNYRGQRNPSFRRQHTNGTLNGDILEEPEYDRLISQVNKYNQQLNARDESRKKVGSFQVACLADYFQKTLFNSGLPDRVKQLVLPIALSRGRGDRVKWGRLGAPPCK